jgi:hypothetical protein
MSAGRSVSGTERVDGAVPSSRISPASSGGPLRTRSGAVGQIPSSSRQGTGAKDRPASLDCCRTLSRAAGSRSGMKRSPVGGSPSSPSTLQSTGAGLAVPRSGWTKTPTIRTGVLMVSPFHQVFTRNPGKVKTKTPAIMVMIALLKRYVLIRVLIYTDSQERRACLRERVTRLLVSVKSTMVKTSRIFLRKSGRSENRLHQVDFRGVSPGVKM